jgi:hypothetical protein
MDSRHIEQVNALMRMEGMEANERSRALDQAMLAGRASLAEVGEFLRLYAKLVAADEVLKVIGTNDDRYEGIVRNRALNREIVREMAVKMDGAVRVAFEL